MKTWEIDVIAPRDVSVHIEGYEKSMRPYWEMNRALCYTVSISNASDPKKFPNVKKFMPLPWDKIAVNESANDILSQHARMVARRERLENKLKKK